MMKRLQLTERIEPILALLDEGLALYRRNFVPFLLITAICIVPFAILVGVAILLATRADDPQFIVLLLGLALLMLPLPIYLVGGLSRGAGAALAGQPVNVRAALRIGPVRLLGMGLFSVMYGVLAQVASSILSMICICPLYIVGAIGFAGLLALDQGGTGFSVIIIAVTGVIFAGVYIFALVVGGTTYSSLIYALQPWVQEQAAFGASLQRSLDLVAYRFGRNLVVWGFSALLVAAVGFSVTLAVGLVVPLPLAYVLGDESRIVQAVSATAWIIGLIVVLPPLPIWMALLYQRNLAEREGQALDAQVQAWWQRSFGSQESGARSQEPEVRLSDG